jgi:hypothetical protein
MPEISSSRYLVTIGIDDVPHLDAKTKAEMEAETHPLYRDARLRGIPGIGAGLVYPLPFEEIACKPFIIPAWWPRGYALDVGWNRTAAVWGAWDREVDVLYLYAEHYKGQAIPSTHAAAIKARGEWIHGCIDPAAAGSNQKDGTRLIDEYSVDQGLNLIPAENALEAGIMATWQRLETGRLKVFTTLTNLQDEYRVYRRDEKDKLVGEDHLMDCMRYIVLNFRNYFSTKPTDLPTGRAVLPPRSGA